jgi:serine/threonine protein kinase
LNDLQDQNIRWNTLLQLGSGITNGLNEIHNVGILHKNLHTGNILVDKNGIARITDFGIYRFSNSKNVFNFDQQALLQFRSPEIRSGATFDERSDIYSLGVVFWAISAGHNPPLNTGDFWKTSIVETPTRYKPLYKSCLEEDPNNRPSTEIILKDLNEMLCDQQILDRQRMDLR